MSFDPYISILSRVEEKLDSIAEDLAQIKEGHSELKVEQSKCESRWGLLGKFLTFGLGSLSVTSIWSWISGHK